MHQLQLGSLFEGDTKHTGHTMFRIRDFETTDICWQTTKSSRRSRVACWIH